MNEAADDPAENELVYEGRANYFHGMEAIGGKLRLTTRELIFTPHKVNIQRHVQEWSVTDVVGVAEVRSFGIVPNGLAVTLSSNELLRFAVWHRQRWIDALSR